MEGSLYSRVSAMSCCAYLGEGIVCQEGVGGWVPSTLPSNSTPSHGYLELAVSLSSSPLISPVSSLLSYLNFFYWYCLSPLLIIVQRAINSNYQWLMRPLSIPTAEFIIALAEKSKRLDKFKKELEENGGDQFAVSCPMKSLLVLFGNLIVSVSFSFQIVNIVIIILLN